MATNSSNSNSVNINSLPQAQIAADADLLILETQNGTQTIPFQNFNVVRTDVAGNATVVGNLTGTSSLFSQVETTTLKVSQVFTDNTLAPDTSFGYQNRFQTTNGIVVSSDYVIGSPEYTTLYNLYQTVSANSSQFYKKVYEYNGIASISNGAVTSALLNVGGFPTDTTGVSVGSLLGNSTNYATYFTLTPFQDKVVSTVPATPVSLSAVNYFPGSGPGDDYLTFVVGLQSANSTGGTIKVGVRVVYFYN